MDVSAFEVSLGGEGCFGTSSLQAATYLLLGQDGNYYLTRAKEN